MKNRFPEGWDEKKVKTVLSHYEKQTEDESVEEDELAFKNRNLTVMEIPVHLVSKVRELIVKSKSIKRNDTATTSTSANASICTNCPKHRRSKAIP